MKSKLVSIDEANQMLPLLKSIVDDIRYCWEQIIAKRTELAKGDPGRNQGGPPA